MSDIRDDAADEFATAFGYTPDGIWSAPGRVNLIGEHTDYNAGLALPLAINRRTVVAVGGRDDGILRVASGLADEVASIPLTELSADRLSGWSAYPLGVAWALGRLGADLNAVPGLDLYIESTVPVGAGLSSSAALEISVALALDDLWRLGLDRAVLAHAGRVAENEVVGAPTGPLDQLASVFGRRDHALLVDARTLETTPVSLDLAKRDSRSS